VTEEMHLQKKKLPGGKHQQSLMSIHDAKTLGEPISSSSNTQRFKRNMFLSLVSYPHLIKPSWNNKKKMKPIDG